MRASVFFTLFPKNGPNSGNKPIKFGWHAIRTVCAETGGNPNRPRLGPAAQQTGRVLDRRRLGKSK